MIDLPTSDQALEKLMVGNRRYVAMRQLHPRQNQMQRQAMLEGQHPFAAILSCSDSRVPSELIFDQGLGDLFIVRTAGHVISDFVIGSLEFAVHYLRVPLVLVMGHGQCGAVAAAVKGQPLPGHIGPLTATLRPAIESVQGCPGDLLVNAIKANARYTAKQLTEQSTILSRSVETGELKIVPSFFELETSAIELLIEDPA